jgi:hypothetical protein
MTADIKTPSRFVQISAYRRKTKTYPATYVQRQKNIGHKIVTDFEMGKKDYRIAFC